MNIYPKLPFICSVGALALASGIGIYIYKKKYDHNTLEKITPKNGLVTEYYENGNIRHECNYVNDLRHGEMQHYYINGKLEMQADYNMDKLHGEYREYHTNGNIKLREHFVNNIRHGSSILYNRNGEKSIECYYANGILHGEYKRWYCTSTVSPSIGYCTSTEINSEHISSESKNSVLQLVCNYIGGQLHGEYKRYDTDGNLELSKHYVNDIEHGTHTEFYQNGKIYITYELVNDKYHGTLTKYTKDGTKIVEREYHSGRLHGYSKQWYLNGTLLYHVEFENGIVTNIVEANNENGNNVILPDGELTVYKACRTYNGIPVYVQLTIPSDAHRTKYILSSNKYRAEYAIVVSITDQNGNNYDSCHSFVHGAVHGQEAQLEYKVGKTVYPDSYDPDVTHECSSGINFHLTKTACMQWF